ncbi:HAL/PAL/TAL family ammonia-lyase [Catalinimonas niigatensis]|uniref:HAL/PAL/TAL family ammonia-lyase n=1 Tax=Catalinimonas niigatensis TaxID=1397264 RepID=UPI0026650FDB|nr:aromatic amino acid ammonia-lyase [Catalinimonas niigatensis]WPP48755.1 aromatic amino acid ammonia-lyase [Catalinimonas niigatensis]
MIQIGIASLELSDIEKVLLGRKVGVSEGAKKQVEESFNFLREFSKNKLIYGINTGFGPMAQYRIDESEQRQLQYNLIRSHSSGMGQPLEAQYVKASMLARLNTLSLGYSGVNTSALEVLVNLINHDVTPLIYEHGGVGASGDLVQLAHLALVMIGEGEVSHQGKILPTDEVFRNLGIKPMQISLREGLAVMNGTSVMTGIGLINSLYAQRAVSWSLMATAMICEMVDSYDDYFSTELNHSKKHRGQQQVSQCIKQVLDDSQYSRKREEQLYSKLSKEKVLLDKVQEYYSIRCVPQIVGIILETVQQCQRLLVEEVNSANDNPIIDLKSRNVLHGGNFHGDYVAFEMDKLKIAIAKLSMLAERQLNFLMNPKLNSILPPFVNLGKLGFNFGMQGVQFTATSTTAENQMLANPMYIHSIPNNNDNQDIVSMGTNAALCTKKVIENTFEVLAIEMVTIVQAFDYLQKTAGLSGKSKLTYHNIRGLIPSFVTDFPIHKELKRVKEYMMEHAPLEIDMNIE